MIWLAPSPATATGGRRSFKRALCLSMFHGDLLRLEAARCGRVVPLFDKA